jgi:hypothetical protein
MLPSMPAQKEKLDPQTPSIGLVIPFYPSMNDDRQINNTLVASLKRVQDELENHNSSAAFKAEAVIKLKALFARLNFLSERKSVAIIIDKNECSTLYLSFNAEPLIIVKEQISFFELIEPTAEDPDFYYLTLEDKNTVLYEYRTKTLFKIFEQSGKNAIHDVCSILNYTNPDNLKPVFVQGPRYLTDKFANRYGLQKIIFKNPISEGQKPMKAPSSILKITEQWKYWRSHLVSARLRLFQRSDALVHTKANIIHALKENSDGLLLVGKEKRVEICRKWMFDKQLQEMRTLFERFLSRGNRVILVDDEPLVNYDHIVLLKHSRGNFIKRFLHWREESGGLDLAC